MLTLDCCSKKNYTYTYLASNANQKHVAPSYGSCLKGRDYFHFSTTTKQIATQMELSCMKRVRVKLKDCSCFECKKNQKSNLVQHLMASIWLSLQASSRKSIIRKSVKYHNILQETFLSTKLLCFNHSLY